MPFEHYHSQDLLTPSINDGGVNKLNSSLTSLDFYLLEDIDAYLTPIQSKRDLITDSSHDDSQHEEDFFADFDFSQFDHFTEKSDFLPKSTSIDEFDIEKWISQASFPSPPMESNSSPLSTIVEDEFSWIADDFSISTDMIVPPSPPLSSSSSSPAPSMKKTKLSTVERKLRKKDQNKSAAEKYRIKKKSERHILLDRHLKLKNTNKELKLELENLTFRLQKFKQLCVDILHTDQPASI